METENLSLNDCSQWQIVEKLSKDLPHVSISIFPKAFVVEAVHLGNLSGLVVASKDCNSVAVADLKGHQKSDSLN